MFVINFQFRKQESHWLQDLYNMEVQVQRSILLKPVDQKVLRIGTDSSRQTLADLSS